MAGSSTKDLKLFFKKKSLAKEIWMKNDLEVNSKSFLMYYPSPRDGGCVGGFFLRLLNLWLGIAGSQKRKNRRVAGLQGLWWGGVVKDRQLRGKPVFLCRVWSYFLDLFIFGF